MQERFYFGDEVLPLFETGIPLLKQRLSHLPDADKVSLPHDFTLFLSVDYVNVVILVNFEIVTVLYLQWILLLSIMFFEFQNS